MKHIRYCAILGNTQKSLGVISVNAGSWPLWCGEWTGAQPCLVHFLLPLIERSANFLTQFRTSPNQNGHAGWQNVKRCHTVFEYCLCQCWGGSVGVECGTLAVWFACTLYCSEANNLAKDCYFYTFKGFGSAYKWVVTSPWNCVHVTGRGGGRIIEIVTQAPRGEVGGEIFGSFDE